MTTEVATARGSALAIRADQEAFSRDQVDALKKMNGWEDVPDAELGVFFHQSQRTGLDPFARQIYLIGRWSRKNNRNEYTIQTSIDGMRLVADRTGRYAGSDRPKFGKEGGDEWAEVAVWKIVQGTRVPFTGVAFRSEYHQERSPMWTKMPKTMLAKCAEAQALRKAFPADLSGLYSSEEMDQAGPGENGHVIDAEPGADDGHHDLMVEIGKVYAQIPEGQRPGHEQVWSYAEAKVGNARQMLKRLEGLRDEARSVDAAGEEEDAEVVEGGPDAQ